MGDTSNAALECDPFIGFDEGYDEYETKNWQPRTPEGEERLRKAVKAVLDNIDAEIDSMFVCPAVGITAQATERRWNTFPDD